MELLTVSVPVSRSLPTEAVPRLTPDLRPTADTIALSHNPRPELPMSPSAALAAVVASIVAQSTVPTSAKNGDRATDAISGLSRAQHLLKPYGIEPLLGRPRPDPENLAPDRPEPAA